MWRIRYFSFKWMKLGFLTCLLLFLLMYHVLHRSSIRSPQISTREEIPLEQHQPPPHPQWSNIHLGGRPMNVLFFIADDFRLEMGPWNLDSDDPGSYWPSHIHLPTLTLLAKKSAAFTHAFCQYPLCNPSRASLMTSRRPDTTRVYDLQRKFRHAGRNFTTMPQYFKQHGYEVLGTGKIYHGHYAVDVDEPLSWSKPFHHAQSWRIWRKRLRVAGTTYRAVSEEEDKELPIPEKFMVDYAKDALYNMSLTSQPFFLAVGLHRPHEPVISPKKYFSLYKSVEAPHNRFYPAGAPRFSLVFAQSSRSHMMKVRTLNHSDPDDQLEYLLRFKQAYYAAMSYVDNSIGQVLDELERLDLHRNTIVVFSADHGRHLGEHNAYGKHALFELATQVPLLIHVPGLTDDGMLRHQLVELVDLFPTLVELTGLPAVPQCPVKSENVELCTEGDSMAPIITSKPLPWKAAAFSQVYRDQLEPYMMGYSIRTRRFRYTEWVRFPNDTDYRETPWTRHDAAVLYDLDNDPEQNQNCVQSARYKRHLKHLQAVLRAGWREAVPAINKIRHSQTSR